MSRIRTALVGVVAAGLMLMTAGAASATPEPAMPVVSTSVQSQSVSIGGGWSITSSTEITETSIESEQIQSRTVPVSETRQQSADEQHAFPEYKSQIQQPINSDGTSSWPAKRGVIPVQFKLTKTDVTEKRTKSWTEERSGTQLEQRKNVVTTTSTTYDPSFESLVNDGDDTNDFSALTYTPSEPMKVKDIDELVADYDWGQGGTHTGSLRWSIRVSPSQSIFVYYGNYPNFTSESVGNGTGADLADALDKRVDTSQLSGGTFYDDWAHAKSVWGDMNVMRASLVIDSGDQVLDLNSATVNGHHVDVPDTVPGPSSSSTEVGTWQPVGDPTFGDWQKLAGSESTSDWSEVSRKAAVQTNAVPAKIVVEKQRTDTTPLDEIEELSSAQGDTTGYYRQIDGKYMYNLKAESLQKGSFKVFIAPDGYANLDGNSRVLENPGVFELK
jgi:hypothetical protein